MMERHGHAGTSIHTRWKDMRGRCLNPRHKWFGDYGGRGISICKDWESFPQFLADMGYPPSKNHSLDRIDPDKGYCQENCRWATQTTQCRNFSNRNNKFGHRGVNLQKGKYRAYLYVQKKQVFLGSFETAKEAIAARIEGERKHWGAA